MEPTSVIKKALNTEKSAGLKQSNNKYVFKVDIKANKIDIRKAVESIFKVKVLNVNTCIMHGKKRRVRYQLGRRPDWKKAIVSLRAGDRIQMLE